MADVKMCKEQMATHKCIICGKTFTGYGNDPWPVIIEEDCEEDEVLCCDKCNEEVVIPKRVSNITVHKGRRDV